MVPITRSTYARCHGDRGVDSTLPDAHRIYLIHKVLSKDAITVPEQILWCVLPWKRFAHLLRCPFRSWMCRDREMIDASPIVCQYQKHIQNLEPDRRQGEEVDGHHAFCVVFKKRTPSLRRRPSASNHVLTYTGFANVDPQFFGVHRGSSEHPRVDSRGSSCESVRGLRRAPSDGRTGHDESSISRTCEIPDGAIPLRWKLARCRMA